LGLARGRELLAGAQLIARHVVLAVSARNGRKAGGLLDNDVGVAIVA
jgi:hypothetical protein